jgi:PAS domain S-box-containing protein
MKKCGQVIWIVLVFTLILTVFTGPDSIGREHSLYRIDTHMNAPVQTVPDQSGPDNGSQSHNTLIIYCIISGILLLGLIFFLRKRLRDREKQIDVQSRQLDDLSVRQSEAEQHYRQLFNTINDGVVVCDLSVNGVLGAIREVNKQACLIFGRPEEDLKAMPIKDLIDEDERIRIPELINQLQARHSVLCQIRIVTGEGVVRNVEVHANLIETNGSWKTISVIRDISERMIQDKKYRSKIDELEKNLHMRESDIEELRQEVTFLAGTVSHDLQAPLRSVQGSLETLRDSDVIDDEEKMKDIDRIIQQVKRTNGLIKGILEYSRLGRNALDMVPLGLSQICSEVILQLDTLIREEHADVIIERPMPRVLAHSTTLYHVVQNLVLNAVKFTKPGVTPRVVLRAESRNGSVRLWVIDNGIGIAPEYHERIFQVFQRLHGSEEYPGNGLGLAIVRRGIQRMRGSLGLMSEVGEGSRFWLELPAVQENGMTDRQR